MSQGKLFSLLVTLAALFFTAWLPPAARAQPGTSAAQAPKIGQVQSQIDALKQAPLADNAKQKQALGNYQQALQSLKQVADYRQRTQHYQQALQDAADQARQIRNTAEQTPKPGGSVPANASDEKLADQLGRHNSKLAELQSRLEKIDGQLKAAKARPDNARGELDQTRQTLQNIAGTLAGLPGSNQNATVTRSQREALLARQAALTAKTDMLEHELMSNAPRVSLLGAQRDQLRQKIASAQAQVDRLRSAINARQRENALSALRKARKAQTRVKNLPPVVQQAAAQNAQLSDTLNQVTGEIAATSRQQEKTRAELQRITADYQTAQQQLAIAGLTSALGEVLREQRQRLPKITDLRRQPQAWSERIAAARLQQFRIDERRRDLNDVDQAVKQRLSGHERRTRSAGKRSSHNNKPASPKTADSSPALDDQADQAAIRRTLKQLLENRQDLLDQLSSAYSRYVNLLTGLRRDQQTLSQKARAYANLLDESLVWIASARPIGIRWLGATGTGLLWLLSPGHWHTTLSTLLSSTRRHWQLPLLVLIPFIGLIKLRGRMRRRLRAVSENVGNVTRDRFYFTLEALVYAVLFALAWPIPIATIAHLLLISPDATNFSDAVAAGLRSSALWLLILDSFRRLCDPAGLIAAHFRWKDGVRRLMRYHLSWLMALELPCTLIIVLTEHQLGQSYRNGVGRLAFIVGSLGLATFIWLILRRKSGVVSSRPDTDKSGWRLRDLGYLVALASPVLITALAMAGYYFTALRLEGKFFISGWLIVGAVVAVNLVIRALNVAERRLALRRARARREQSKAQRTADKDGSTSSDMEIPEVAEIDLATISDQTRALLRLFVGLGVLLGLWVIWQDLFPALAVLNQVVLWHQTLGSGAATAVIPVTLGNLGMFFILLIVTGMAARNLPGLLELTIVQRLALNPGTRYATTTVLRYIIAAAGILAALDTIGIGWHQAQWLVAAIGVGLGFGLQEIFANFVSGLIILFERPVRIGDTVTVGTISGTVSRIRMRATTITDWDRKELIVPNKNFITNEVVNWSLSDPTLRTIIKIGVAHGSDTQLVQRLISDIASHHPLVLNDPPPQVYFLSFGENALNFELRVFVKSIDDLMPLLHEMHMGLEKALREAGIHIALPQRDIHVRSVTHDLQVGRAPDAGDPAAQHVATGSADVKTDRARKPRPTSGGGDADGG